MVLLVYSGKLIDTCFHNVNFKRITNLKNVIYMVDLTPKIYI